MYATLKKGDNSKKQVHHPRYKREQRNGRTDTAPSSILLVFFVA
jgi:hypothetical protein